MSTDSNPTPEIEVTPEMIEAGAAVFRQWEVSEEPDARPMVRAVVEAVLGRHVIVGSH